MLEYFSLCFVCIIMLCILLTIEPSVNENTPFITVVTIAIVSIPLIPILILLYIITKVIRDD
jgi:hypothetical protein